MNRDIIEHRASGIKQYKETMDRNRVLSNSSIALHAKQNNNKK